MGEGGTSLTPKILCGGGYGLNDTEAIVLEFCFEYCLECPEIDISPGVVLFGTLS